MKRRSALAVLGLLFSTAVLMTITQQKTLAQSAQSTLQRSCSQAQSAFRLRQAGIDGIAVADPSAATKLRQAALAFYRCSQTESDPYLHELALAYYADCLYRNGVETNNQQAIALASASASKLSRSNFDDIRSLVQRIPSRTPIVQNQKTPHPQPTAARHSEVYCTQVAPMLSQTLDYLGKGITAAVDAGKNDTEVLATTNARYGDAFKAVEDDFGITQANLQSAVSNLTAAANDVPHTAEWEQAGLKQTIAAIATTMIYADTFSRLSLSFERGINGANRQIERARISQALASGMRNTSYTYGYGNATCYSYGAYTTSCTGNAQTRTTYDDSADVARQNAERALSAAEAGRLSLSDANNALMQGLPYIEQFQTAVYNAQVSWSKGCDH